VRRGLGRREELLVGAVDIVRRELCEQIGAAREGVVRKERDRASRFIQFSAATAASCRCP
jgi:hypothetical protein